jgi:hypothetical protein
MGFPIADSVLGITKLVLERVITDPKQKAEAVLKLEELHQAGDLQVMTNQSDINKIEAANPRLFISGWRPFIGWICGVGIGMACVVNPLLAAFGHAAILVPVEALTTLVISMLGLGGMRTYEKLNGVAAK